MRHTLIPALAAALLLTGCEIKRESDADALPSASAAAAPDAAAAVSPGALPAPFDPASVPESSAAMPAFPLLMPLEGLKNNQHDADINRAFDRDFFVAGTELVTVEGKVFRGRYALKGDRPYSTLEFLRNHELAIKELGGVKIGGTLSTAPYHLQLRDQTPPPSGFCFLNSCEEADFYLIRQGGKEWWISVGTGSFPLHGYVTVMEKQGMAKSYSFMNAGQLKAELDAKGRVPVYVEFDTNRATIKPAALPAIDEITKLMQGNAALRLSLEGHTDDTGTPARNKPLSLARAEAVKAELLAAGIAPARLKTAGYGSDRPLVQGTDEDARARNRRVELVKF